MEIKIKYVLNGITHIIEGRNVESDLDEELDGCQSTSFMFEISRGLRYFPKVSIPKDLETTISTSTFCGGMLMALSRSKLSKLAIGILNLWAITTQILTQQRLFLACVILTTF
jgi:hypothetical protein